MVSGGQSATEPRDFQAKRLQIPLRRGAQMGGAPARQLDLLRGQRRYVALDDRFRDPGKLPAQRGHSRQAVSATAGWLTPRKRRRRGRRLFGYQNQRETMRTAFEAAKSTGRCGGADARGAIQPVRPAL